jgi:hypothetical protein
MKQFLVFLLCLVTSFASYSQGRTKVQTLEATDSIRLGTTWYRTLPVIVPSLQLAQSKTPTVGSIYVTGSRGGTFNVFPKSDNIVDNGIIFSMTSDTNYVLIRETSQSPVINARWFDVSGDASLSLQTMLNLSSTLGLPVDGDGLTLNVHDITLPVKSSLRNITLNSNDSTKSILHIGTIGESSSISYSVGLSLINVKFTGRCDYALAISNVTNTTLQSLVFDKVNATNDIFYLNDIYESTIDGLRFTSDTAGVGKACFYSPKGMNGMEVKGLYTSSFTDYAFKLTGGASIKLTAPTLQGAVISLYVTGVTGLNTESLYTENTVNTIVINDSLGAPTAINFHGGGYVTAITSASTHPSKLLNNGYIVKVKNAQVLFDGTRFAGVSPNDTTKRIATVDGTAIITFRFCTITGNQTVDLRPYLYRESTASVVAGYNLTQDFTNNSILSVERSFGFANAHITRTRDVNGNWQESTTWKPPVTGTGIQTIVDVWKHYWTETTLDTSLFARKGNFITPADTIHRWLDINAPIANISNFDINNWNGKLSPTSSPILYFPAYIYERGYEVPNVTGIKDSLLIVNGTIGNKYLLVASGNKIAFYNQGAFPVALYDGVSTYKTYYTNGISGDTVYLSTPLRTTVTSGTLKTVHDSYQGQHLTDIAYKALGEYIFNLNKTFAYKNNIAYFDPSTNPPATPFTLVNGATTGGFVPGTDLPQIAQVSSVTTSSSALGSKGYYVQQGTTAGKGVQWSVVTAGRSGFMAMNIALAKRTYNTTLVTAGRVVVTTYINGSVSARDTISQYNVQNIQHPFSKADSIRMVVTTLDTIPTAFVLSRTGIYVTNDTLSSNLFSTTTKTVVLGNSWTQYTMNGSTPRKDMVGRMKELFAANGGDSNNIINVGRSGMTSAWGRYWFDSLVLSKHPTYVILEFYTNDNNSSGFVGDPSDLRWNFSSATPYGTGTDVEGKVTASQWNDNMTWMAQKALANGITPIVFMAGWSGSIAQTQAVLDNFLPLQGNSTYYDVKGLNSYNATIVNNLTADNITAITSADIPVLTNKTKITMGTPTIGGYGKFETLETNSSSAKGFVFNTVGLYTGSVGHILTIQNNGTDVGFLANDGSWVTPFLKPTKGIVIPASSPGIAAFKFNSGLIATSTMGQMEFDSTTAGFYGTPIGTTRMKFLLTNGVLASDGKIPIGSTSGNDYVLGNITAGYGINIVNGSHSITTSVDSNVIAQKSQIVWQKVLPHTLSPSTLTDSVSIGGIVSLSKSIKFTATNTTTGTTGNQTINLPSGSVNFAAGAQTLTVTNSLVTVDSHVLCVVETDDATADGIKCVTVSGGSFVIKLRAACTAETRVSFWVRD